MTVYPRCLKLVPSGLKKPHQVKYLRVDGSEVCECTLKLTVDGKHTTMNDVYLEECADHSLFCQTSQRRVTHEAHDSCTKHTNSTHT